MFNLGCKVSAAVYTNTRVLRRAYIMVLCSSCMNDEKWVGRRRKLVNMTTMELLGDDGILQMRARLKLKGG